MNDLNTITHVFIKIIYTKQRKLFFFFYFLFAFYRKQKIFCDQEKQKNKRFCDVM